MDDIKDTDNESENDDNPLASGEVEGEATVTESQIIKALDGIYELSESPEFVKQAPCPHFVAGVQTALIAVGMSIAVEMGATREQIESIVGTVKAASAQRRSRAAGKKLN